MSRFLSISLYILCFVTAMASIGQAQTPLSFVPIGPCRAVDTRLAVGPFGGPSLAADTARDFTIPNNPACAVPNTALAYSVNVTVVPNGTSLGYLTVWPTGQLQPTVSTLNSYDGRTKADALIVGAGANEAITVYTTDNTDLVLDISGYWVGPGDPAALAYYPLLNICEMANTVNPPNQNGLGGPALLAGVARSFPVSTTPNCTIPPEAVAYSLNVTATPSGLNPLGYLTVWPSTQAQPFTSLLNAPTGTTVANAAVVDAGTGSISVYASDNTDVAIDINGYFAPPGGVGGLALYTLTPCRVIDTRLGDGAFTGLINVDIQNFNQNCAPPAFQGSEEAYVLNATLVPTAGVGYFPIWAHGQIQPNPSTLYALDAAVTSNMAIVPSTDGVVSAFAGGPTNLLYDIFGYFASDALSITTASLPNGVANTPYGPFVMTAQGGVPPYSWSSADLPALLTISSNGIITGCPLAAGSPSVTITVTDQLPTIVNKTFTLTIAALNPLAITTTSLPDGQVGIFYDQTVLASGGLVPYKFTLFSGPLPPGLFLALNGTISGIPSQTGTFPFVVEVTDSECPSSVSVLQNLSITIQ